MKKYPIQLHQIYETNTSGRNDVKNDNLTDFRTQHTCDGIKTMKKRTLVCVIKKTSRPNRKTCAPIQNGGFPRTFVN